MQIHAPAIALYTRDDLPRLALLLEETWAELAHARRTLPAPAFLGDWKGVERNLSGAAMQLGTAAFTPTFPSTAPASTSDVRLNFTAQTLSVVAFVVELTAARAERRAEDKWLVARAPRVLGPTPWQALLNAALLRLGMPLEEPPQSPVVASGLPRVLGDELRECVSFLMSMCLRSHFQSLAASYGAGRLRPYLVSLLDASLMSLDAHSGRREPSAAPLLIAAPHLRALREQLAAWAPTEHEVPEEQCVLARRALEAADYPVPSKEHPLIRLPC